MREVQYVHNSKSTTQTARTCTQVRIERKYILDLHVFIHFIAFCPLWFPVVWNLITLHRKARLCSQAVNDTWQILDWLLCQAREYQILHALVAMFRLQLTLNYQDFAFIGEMLNNLCYIENVIVYNIKSQHKNIRLFSMHVVLNTFIHISVFTKQILTFIFGCVIHGSHVT